MIELAVGDILEGVVTDYASEGEGVVKLNGYPVFVPFAIKGEKIRAKVLFVKKDWAIAELASVEEPSPHRIKPRCPYFTKCGGCDLQHIELDEQLRIKQKALKTALKKVSGIDAQVPLPVTLGEWQYRNKLALPFGFNRRSERVYLGFYAKHSHSVVPIKWCPLHGEWASMLILTLTAWANEYKISIYDEKTHEGLLRHAVARMCDTLSLTLVINGDKIPHLDELYSYLSAQFTDVALYASENTRYDNVILGDDVRLVRGAEKPQNLGKFHAVISPSSFLQVNDKIRDAVYDKTAELLEDFDGDIVELYSGVGILTAQLALRLPSASFTSVEIEGSACKDAESLMKSLGLSDRVKILNADALAYVEGQAGKKRERKRALLLDPPRRGLDKRLAELINEMDFERIVYISCNPQTLARDLKLLSAFKTSLVIPYDMFPQTSNLETLVRLDKKE